MAAKQVLLTVLAAAGLAGCVAYPEPVPVGPRPVYAAPPPRYYAPPPPPPVYVAPRPQRRQWVPRRCDRWGRCYGGFWR